MSIIEVNSSLKVSDRVLSFIAPPPVCPSPLSAPPPVCSPCGKKFRSKPQIARFLGEGSDLSPFDFSRAGTPGDGSQRRRARDRSAKKFDIFRPVPLVRPLSNNPLRPSGPIRRTCGVIKLPVTWIYVPAPLNEENETTPPKPANSKETEPEEKPAAISALPLTAGGNGVAVPALWENRLLGVKACDHETGDDIVPTTDTQNGMVPAVISSPTLMDSLTGSSLLPKVSTKSLIPGATNSFQKLTSAIRSPTSISSPVPEIAASLLTQHLQKSLMQGGSSAVIPSLLQRSEQILPSPPVVTLKNDHSKTKSRDASTSHLTSNDIVYLSIGKTIQPSKRKTHMSVSSTHLAASRKTNGPPHSVGEQKVLDSLSRLITDNDLKLQEEKVRHLRQQLLAAERN